MANVAVPQGDRWTGEAEGNTSSQPSSQQEATKTSGELAEAAPGEPIVHLAEAKIPEKHPHRNGPSDVPG
jgi:hypothetical protein